MRLDVSYPYGASTAGETIEVEGVELGEILAAASASGFLIGVTAGHFSTGAAAGVPVAFGVGQLIKVRVCEEVR